MATMYPRPIPETWKNDGKRITELRVYGELDRALDDSWHVFYDVSWVLKSGNEPVEDRQTDFVLCHPDHGVMLIEVKGGIIAKNGITGLWTSTDRRGVSHPLYEGKRKGYSPALQVKTAMYSLKRKFMEAYSWEPNLGRALAFPDCRYKAQMLEIDRDFLIDGDDFLNLAPKVGTICEYWKRKKEMEPFSQPHLEFLKSCLASSMSTSDPLDLQIDQAKKRMLELTQEQFEILYSLNGNPRVAIQGGAGTGKTVLAVEKAKRLANEGFEVLLTCVSRELEHFLQRSMGPPVERLTILPFEELCRIISIKGGIPVAGRREDQSLTDYRENTLPGQLKSALEHTDLRFDAIIVDEAQDFDAHWWDALESCLRSPREGVFWVFFDDNQNVYGRPSCIPSNSFVYSLTKSFRNTQEIFRFSSRFYKGGKLTSIGTVGPPVEIVSLPNAGVLTDAVSQALKVLFDKRIEPEDISILTPKPIEGSQLAKSLRASRSARPNEFERKANNVLIQSIHLFKGLERNVVIVCEIDGLGDQEASAHLYVGMSRPKFQLIVMATNDTLARFGLTAQTPINR